MGVTKGKKGGQNKSKALFFFCYLLNMFTGLREIPQASGLKCYAPSFSVTLTQMYCSADNYISNTHT